MSGLKLEIPKDPVENDMLTPTGYSRSRRSTVSSGEMTVKSTTPTRHRSRSGSTINTTTGASQPLPAVPPIPASLRINGSTTAAQNSIPNGDSLTSALQGSASGATNEKAEVPPRKPIVLRSGLHESLIHSNYQKYPKMSQFSDVTAPLSSMYWSKAPVWGSMPTHCFKSHTCTAVGNTIWIIGGRYGPDGKNDTTGWDEPIPPKDKPFWNIWCFDTITLCWSRPKVKGDCPPSLRAHSAALFNNHIIIVFGGGGWDGQRSVFYNDIYSFDTHTHTWTNLTPFLEHDSPIPVARRSHSAVIRKDRMYVFGGGTGKTSLNDLWVLDLSEVLYTRKRLRWQEVKLLVNDMSLLPQPRGYHTANIVKNWMVIYGGVKGVDDRIGNIVLDDVWLFNTDTYQWTNVTPDPVLGSFRRAFHTSTHIGSYLFVFGGHDGINYQNKTLMFNMVELIWDDTHSFPGKAPCPRGYHAAAYSDLRIWIFGGMNGEAITSASSKWLTSTAASPTMSVSSVSVVGSGSGPASRPSGRSRASSVREGRDRERELRERDIPPLPIPSHTLNSLNPPPVARSASLTGSISTLSSINSVSTVSTEINIKEQVRDRDGNTPMQSRPPSRPPTRERDRNGCDASFPATSTIPVIVREHKERSAVLSDVYMLDLGTCSYIPLMTNYSIVLNAETDESGAVEETVQFISTDPVTPGLILKPLRSEERRGGRNSGQTSPTSPVNPSSGFSSGSSPISGSSRQSSR